ncbi:hypothetical protein Tco_0221967 [Tanacetum coccineum]
MFLLSSCFVAFLLTLFLAYLLAFFLTCFETPRSNRRKLDYCSVRQLQLFWKGFHLLGITQKPSLQAVSAALALNYVAPSEVPSPLKNPKIRTRFEVFTAYVYITRDPDFKDGELFGCIQVSDYYGLRPDGWGVRFDHGPGDVSLLSHDCRHCEKMQNNDQMGGVPFSSSMRNCMLLYATTKDEDDFFQVCNVDSPLDFSPFLESDSPFSREYLVAKGDDGHMRMHYILFRDAVDATIESLYKASLLESFDGSGFEDGDVRLTRSVLAVPMTGSLVIEARLKNLATRDYILHGSCVFKSNCNGIFDGDIKNEECTLKVKVTWSQD